MIEKDGAHFVASCDFCSNHHDTEERDFYAAVEAVKRAGWRVFKQGQEWLHKCADCLGVASSEDFENV